MKNNEENRVHMTEMLLSMQFIDSEIEQVYEIFTLDELLQSMIELDDIYLPVMRRIDPVYYNS